MDPSKSLFATMEGAGGLDATTAAGALYANSSFAVLSAGGLVGSSVTAVLYALAATVAAGGAGEAGAAGVPAVRFALPASP